MKKYPVLFVLAAGMLLAATDPKLVTVTAPTKFLFGASSMALKPGTQLQVEGRSGDDLVVYFHKLRGHLPRKDTDFKGDVPEVPLEAPKAAAAVAAAPAPKTDAPKPAATAATPPPPSVVSDQPASTYGRLVKKAQDNRDKHTDALVDPVDEINGKGK